ncbi:MAG: SGNH/GDSL hydrolase family protein [bacterium]|nr:SGNH/GDSL hydrolase family protein [bacterium]
MPARPRLIRSRLVLYSSVTVAVVMTILAAALTLANLREFQERARLRSALFMRIGNSTIGSLLRRNGESTERRDDIHACYLRPDRINLDRISWDLYCRPTPFVGYAPQPGRQAEGVFNEQQMRDPRPVAMPKPAGLRRIFLTGGSFAYGIGAPGQQATISAYLERDLNAAGAVGRTEVFNAAVCGYTTTQERIWIENRLGRLAPDVVIALTGANDAHWGFQGADILDFRTYEDEMYLELINSSMRRIGLDPFPRIAPLNGGKPLAPEAVAATFTRNVRLTAAALALSRTRYVVALQPILSPRRKPLSPGERRWLATEPPDKVEYIERCYDAILRAFEPAAGGAPPPPNVTIADLRDAFAGRSDSIFMDLFHTGDKGNELMAARLAGSLTKISGVNTDSGNS